MCGSKVLGHRATPRARPELAEPEDVADPRKPRRVIDYSLERRRALGRLVLGQRAPATTWTRIRTC